MIVEEAAQDAMDLEDLQEQGDADAEEEPAPKPKKKIQFEYSKFTLTLGFPDSLIQKCQVITS